MNVGNIVLIKRSAFVNLQTVGKVLFGDCVHEHWTSFSLTMPDRMCSIGRYGNWNCRQNEKVSISIAKGGISSRETLNNVKQECILCVEDPQVPRILSQLLLYCASGLLPTPYLNLLYILPDLLRCFACRLWEGMQQKAHTR